MAILNITTVLRDGHKRTGKHISENSDDECVDSVSFKNMQALHGTQRHSGHQAVYTYKPETLQERGTAS